jgi:hypothetical protein
MMQTFSEDEVNEFARDVIDNSNRAYVDYVGSLVAAVLIALTAKHPHQRSPAFAAQAARICTNRQGETDWSWAERFLSMSGDDYRVGWAIQGTEWTYSKDIRVCGLTIAQGCLYWLQRNWDFKFHERDDRIEYDDEKFLEEEANAQQELARSDLSDFLLPAREELVRRVWKSVKGQLRMLDIWKAPGQDQYYYAIRDSGSPEILARSIEPHYPHVLKELLETELLPAFASAPFVVKASPSQLYKTGFDSNL